MTTSQERTAPGGHAAGSLVAWLLRQDLLRGPFLFVDYWASVLRFPRGVPPEHEELGLVDQNLFRLGLDRPDLEIPRLRYYLLLFLTGPLLFPLRSFRRMGRYKIRFRRRIGEDLLEALERFRLGLIPAGPGRVNVRKGETELASDIMDPYLVSGFSSVFYAAYKLPLAAMSAILLVAILAPVLSAAELLDEVGNHLSLIGFPVLVLLLFALYRDWITSVLGALPVLIGAYIVRVFRPAVGGDWTPVFLALGGLFVLYLFIDWFFLPRPVPPVLMLYTSDGTGRPYEREHDSPYWLEGSTYWVWRYLILTPAELNKFWEKDWERVELWIRADGESPGALEWIVSDAHYRELWIPLSRLGSAESLAVCRDEAVSGARNGVPGTWLLEVDADQIFHTPFFRVLSYLPEEGRIPARRVGHLLRGFWKHAKEDQMHDAMALLERVHLEQGVDLMEDVPEFIAHRTARHLLSQPWRYWRYPLGANRRRESRLYEKFGRAEEPLASDPALQIKAEEFT
jgi:hypothetical protein